METVYLSSSSLSTRQDASVTYDELSMQQSLLFSDSLKDLKNLRSQLYSAAEYFELSYTQDDQKQIVVSSLKDYAVKALVNTVDHLGSVSYKVNGLLDEKFDEVCGTEILVSCIEQRLRTSQQIIDQQGLSQQSLRITAPKYHKHYILPVGETILVSARQAVPEYEELKQTKVNGELKQLQTGNVTSVHSTISGRTPSFRKLHSISPSPRARSPSPSQKGRSPSPSFPGKFSFKEKRAVSPLPTSNLLARSGSLSRRSINPNPSNIGRPYPLEPQKSASMRLHAERNDSKETEQTLTKSRSILKALLSRRRSRNDDTLSSYLNEY